MITDEQVRGIALFFLFTLMDEKIALHAAQKTVSQLKASANRRGRSAEVDSPLLVRALWACLQQQKKLLARTKELTSPEPQLVFPDGVDFSVWTKFHRDTGESEVIAVVLSKILKVSDQDIADGLNTSLGTVRYRIGKGIRQLGLAARARA